jgi:hypothetical protein
MEQLFNIYSTTLSASYTAGAGVIQVTSAAGLPSTGQFALTILDQTSLAIKVILRGAFIGGTTIAVTAEGSDANANSGDIVVGSMMTVRSLTQVLEDWLGYGPTANLPSATGRKLGQRFKVNDGNFEYILDDGTLSSPASGSPLWVPYYRGIRTAIANQSFSWINQTGAAVTTQADNSILLQGTANGGVNMQIRVFTAPVSTPYKYKFLFTPILALTGNSRCGVLFSDGTKHADIDITFSSGIQFEAVNMNTATSVNAGLTLTSLPPNPTNASGQPLVFGLGDDGANRSMYWYPDGYTEILLFQVGRTNFLTATELGFFVDDNSANKGTAMILHGIERVI